MIFTDDFSGLTSLIKGLFPQTDHQLCMVHVFRNVHKHLDKEEYSAFKQIFSEIYISSSYEVAFDRFTSLCITLEKNIFLDTKLLTIIVSVPDFSESDRKFIFQDCKFNRSSFVVPPPWDGSLNNAIASACHY